MAKLFVSTMLYAASKRLGHAGAARELMRQVQQADLENDEEPGIPVAHIIAQAARLEDVQIQVSAGATVIGLARSLGAAEFLESDADVWLAADDDMRVSADAIAALVSQCRAEPCLTLTPYLMRDTLAESKLAPRVSIVAAGVAVQDRAPSGGTIETVDSGGFGCFAVSREVIQWAWDEAGPELEFVEKGRLARRVIADEVLGRLWVTEDIAFCRRIASRYRRWAVRVGTSIHAGQRLDLATLEALVRGEQLVSKAPSLLLASR